MASIRKRGNAYQIEVACGYDSTGKKIRRTTTFRPDPLTAKGHTKSETTIQKEVAAFAADFERKVLTGCATDGQRITFERFSEKYLSECAKPSQAPRTFQNTQAAIDQFVNDFGYMTLDNITPMFLQEYVNNLQKAKRKDGKPGTLSYETIKRKAAVLSASLSQAVRWDLIAFNPMDRVQLRKPSTPDDEKLKFFTPEQAETFLDVLDKPMVYQYGGRKRKDSTGKIYSIKEYQSEHSISAQFKLLFYFLMFTGCRRGELIALKWQDIDFQESSVNINKSCCRVDGEVITKVTKNKSVRSLALPAVVTDLLKQWKTDQLKLRMSLGSAWKGDDYIFIRWNGEQMGLDTPYHKFREIIDNYNSTRPEGAPELPAIPLHGLRHTSATLLIGRGIDPKTVSERLGHFSTSTTLNIYAHALKELDRKAADTLENVLLHKA